MARRDEMGERPWSRGRWWLAAGLAVGLGLLLRTHGLHRWLPDVFEEAMPVRRAMAFWGPQTGRFDFDPHFFNYPALSFYLHFAFQAARFGVGWLTGQIASLAAFRQLVARDMASFVLLGRAVTVLCDLAVVLLAGLLAARLGGRRSAGLLAMVLTAVSAVQVHYSQWVVVDVPLTALTLLALLGVLRLRQRRRRVDFVAAGVLIGLATAMKYPAALLATSLLAAVYPSLRQTAGRRAALLGLASAMLASAATFLLLNPYVLLDFSAFWQDFSFERTHMVVGHFRKEEGSSPAYYLGVLWQATGVFGVAATVGAAWAARRRDGAWATVCVWVLASLVVVSSWAMRAEHYVLPLVPVILALGAAVVVAWAARLGRRRGAAVVAVAVGLYAWPQAASLRTYYASITRPETRVQARQWLESHAPAGALVCLESYCCHYQDAAVLPYAVLEVPFASVHPELMSAFYDLRWYDRFEYLAISSFVFERYLDEAERFPVQAAFYRDLERRWPVAARFEARGLSGPTVVIYRNPVAERVDHPFDASLFASLHGASAEAAQAFLARLGYVLNGAT